MLSKNDSGFPSIRLSILPQRVKIELAFRCCAAVLVSFTTTNRLRDSLAGVWVLVGAPWLSCTEAPPAASSDSGSGIPPLIARLLGHRAALRAWVAVQD